VTHHAPTARYCPSCGGPDAARRPDAPCGFCGAPLLPVGAPDPRTAVRCHRCATLVPGGASFCSACGDALSRVGGRDPAHGCPRCGEEVTPAPRMSVWGICASQARPDGHPVHGCERCGGAWVDKETLAAVIRTMAERAPPSEGRPAVHRRSLSGGTFSAKVVYRRCAVCNERMHRRNFARMSGVIVDECGTHGTFFDAGELEDVLAFVQSGGLAMAEERRRAEAQREVRRSEIPPSSSPAMRSSLFAPDEVDVGVAFVRWAVRWLRRAV
jgi:Zn-finger nucleic acid-binding protein